MHPRGEARSNSSRIGVRGMARLDVPAIFSILGESPEASLWSEGSLMELGSSGTAWVAEHEGIVIGFLIGRAAADEFEILNVAIARSHRRRGIATQLVEAALEWSRRPGTQRAYLEVRASNEAAIALYKRHGFSPCGRRSRYYQDPVEDAVILSWDRNPTL